MNYKQHKVKIAAFEWYCCSICSMTTIIKKDSTPGKNSKYLLCEKCCNQIEDIMGEMTAYVEEMYEEKTINEHQFFIDMIEIKKAIIEIEVAERKKIPVENEAD